MTDEQMTKDDKDVTSYFETERKRKLKKKKIKDKRTKLRRQVAYRKEG